MKRSFSILIFGFLLIVSSYAVCAQEQPQGFDPDLLEQLQSDEDYQYELVKPAPEGFFERLWNRFVNWFWGLFQAEGSRSALDIIFKLFLAVAFVYFMAKVLGGDISGVFKSNKGTEELHYALNEEHLDEINFEKEIDQALSISNYRLVIRLYYLSALKKASESEWIVLMQGKTNHDYLYELKGNPIESDFQRLSHLFDYTWYGHFEVDKGLAEKARVMIERIDQQKEEVKRG